MTRAITNHSFYWRHLGIPMYPTTQFTWTFGKQAFKLHVDIKRQHLHVIKCRFPFHAQRKLDCIHESPVQWHSPNFKVDAQVQTCASTLNLRRVSSKLLSVNIQSILVQVWGRRMINPLRQWRAKHQGGEMKPQT